MICLKNSLAILAALALVAGCSKKKDDDEADTEAVAATPAASSPTTATSTSSEASKPGKVVNTLDTAMSTVSFEGQAAALNLTAWEDEHCKSSGSGVADAYQNDETVKWGCKLRVATNGPDTPRGAVARVKALACSLDRALDSGDLAIDGALHTVPFLLDDVCWGTSFATMVKESPNFADKIDPVSGWVKGELKVTAYQGVPSTMSDVSGDWNYAYIIDFGNFTGADFSYHLLTRFDSNVVSAQIREVSADAEENPGVFAMSIDFQGGEQDLATFRYEGRFYYGTFGDGSFGSRHVRVVASGPYAGSGGFSSISSAEGFEAEMWGSDANTKTNGRMSTFKANAAGILAKWWQTDATGAIQSSPSTGWSGDAGATQPDAFTFTATADEISAFLVDGVGTAATAAEAWFKAKSPLTFTAVTIDGE